MVLDRKRGRSFIGCQLYGHLCLKSRCRESAPYGSQPANRDEEETKLFEDFSFPLGIDYKSMATAQEHSKKVAELKKKHEGKSMFHVPVNGGEFSILWEILGEKARPVVPPNWITRAFNAIHQPCHPEAEVTIRKLS